MNDIKEAPKVIVGVLIYNDKGEIFLGKSSGKISNKWVVVGGHLEYGETLKDCARREVKEETNLDIDSIDFLGIQEAIFPEYFNEKKHMVFFDYQARVVGNNEVILNDEHSDYQWVQPQKALQELDLSPSTRIFIEKFIQKNTSE